MSGKQYAVPAWSPTVGAADVIALPKYSLDLIKGGVHIDSIALKVPIEGDRFHLVFGRQPDAVDVQLDHQSISRQHAVVQYHADGSLHLLDWGSAAGTFINKKQLQSNAYERLFVGDIVKFGASSRAYVVTGPESQSREEYDSASVQALRRRLAEQTERAEKHFLLEEERKKDGVSWGFAEDAQEEVDEEEAPSYLRDAANYERKYGERYSADIAEEEVNAKDAQLLEKIRQREAKVRHMQEENSRIYMKEASQEGGLTEGQATTVRRNDARILELTGEVHALVHQIQSKEAARQGSGGKATLSSSAARRGEDDEEERGWLDTTKRTEDASTNFRLRKRNRGGLGPVGSNGEQQPGGGAALSYEDLAAERTRVQRSTAALEAVVAEAAAAVAAQAGADHEGGDAIEAALRSSAAAEASARLVRARAELSSLAERAALVERLLRIATPAIASLVARGAPDAVPPRVESLTAPVEAPIAAHVEAPIAAAGGESVPPVVAPIAAPVEAPIAAAGGESAPPVVAPPRVASVNSISYILQRGKRKAQEEGEQQPRRVLGPASGPGAEAVRRHDEQSTAADERVSSWTAPSQQQQRKVADLQARLGY